MPGFRFHPLVAFLILSFSVVTAAGAQQGGSVLSLLPAQGRSLSIPTEAQGALSSSDFLSAQDSYLEAWTLEGTPGQSVTIDLISEEIDPFLYVVGPGLVGTLSDDDSGPGCNARITFTMLEAGTFLVVASTLAERGTGTYTLRVGSEVPPDLVYPCGGVNPATIESATPQGALEMGAEVSGQLALSDPIINGGRNGQVWTLEGSAGDGAVITLESDAFDAYLYVWGPGMTEPLSDDDGAGDLNSRIELRFPGSGTYRVVATGLGEGATGAYTLRVEAPLDPATMDTQGRTAVMGQVMEGVLSETDPIAIDGRRGQAWAFSGEAGQTVTIELMSEEFDTYLYLAGPGLREPLSDDDSAGDLNSRIVTTLPETGEYRIIVSGISSSATGNFTLSVGGS